MQPARKVIGASLLVAVFITIGTFAAHAQTTASPGGTFFDDDGDVFEGAIEAIVGEGITVGCNRSGSFYCPDSYVTRYEMATFLTRATGLTPVDPIDFTDVGGVHARSVGALESAGWVKGCNPPENTEFCGDRAVNRGEMAAMLVRAFRLDATAQNRFVDDDGSVFETDIDALAFAGIAKGCDPPANTRYCPDEPVTRAQMAGFLTRALHLRAPSPSDPFDGRMVVGSPGAGFGLNELATLDGTRVPRDVLSNWVWQPTLSPDAATIAYIDLFRLCPNGNPKSQGCSRRLFAIPFSGGPERQLTPDWLDVAYYYDATYAWSEDGSSIWFSAKEDGATSLWSVDVQTASLIRIITLSGDVGVVWSPRGAAAAVSQDQQKISVIDPKGAEVASFSHSDTTFDLVRWSADGRLLAYLSSGTSDAVESTGISSIVVADPTNGTETTVAQVGHVTNLAWSPDGTSIAYVEVDESTTGDTVRVVNATGGEPETIVGLPGGASGTLEWSPDGTGVAFVWDSNGIEDPLLRQVWVVRIADRNMWPLTPPDDRFFQFDWG